MIYSMLGGFFDSFHTIITELFNFIPKIMYLLYASLACVLDVLQLFFRKIAGLDVYYVDGKPVQGDLVTNFIGGILGFTSDGFSYSALSTVFWAFVVFGVIMVFISTFVAIIKSHYSYDDKAAKGPMQYVYTAGKAIINIAAVPIIVFIGLFVSQALLTALDTITSTSSGTVASAFGTTESGESVASQELRSVKTRSGAETYVFYDLFGAYSSVIYNGFHTGNPEDNDTDGELGTIASASATFSGQLFKVAAYNGNRARTGNYTIRNSNFKEGSFTGGSGDANGGTKLFANAKTQEELAEMIDLAFASNLHLKNSVELIYDENPAVDKAYYITSFFTSHISSFSKFNIGAVWYYYDLWQFNFIVGFAACIICVAVFINIIMGLITRLFMCIGLFLVAPPLFGLSPIDGGKAGKSWTENFVKQVLMAYGAVVGMNLFFLILPYINNISFFNIGIADYFVQALIIITGLVTIKAFIAMASGLIGGADANKTGADVKEEVGSVAAKAGKMTIGAAKIAANPVGNTVRAVKGAGMMIGGAVQAGIGKVRAKAHAVDRFFHGGKADDLYEKKENLFSSYNDTAVSDLNREEFLKRAHSEGISMRSARAMWNTLDTAAHATGAGDTINTAILNDARNAYANSGTDSGYTNRHNGTARRAAAWDAAAGRFTTAFSGAQTRHKNIVKSTERWQSHGVEKVNSGAKKFGDSGILTPLTQIDSVFGEDKGYKAAKGVFFPKEDYAKTTAKNTGAILQQSVETNKYLKSRDKDTTDSRYKVLLQQFRADNGRDPTDEEDLRLKKDAAAGNVTVESNRRPTP